MSSALSSGPTPLSVSNVCTIYVGEASRLAYLLAVSVLPGHGHHGDGEAGAHGEADAGSHEHDEALHDAPAEPAWIDGRTTGSFWACI